MKKPMAQPTLSAMDKKRIRDRRAQQRSRDKKENHVRQLEQAVSYCQKYHTPQYLPVHVERVDTLEAENVRLCNENLRLRNFTQSYQRAALELMESLPDTLSTSLPNRVLDKDNQSDMQTSAPVPSWRSSLSPKDTTSPSTSTPTNEVSTSTLRDSTEPMNAGRFIVGWQTESPSVLVPAEREPSMNDVSILRKARLSQEISDSRVLRRPYGQQDFNFAASLPSRQASLSSAGSTCGEKSDVPVQDQAEPSDRVISTLPESSNVAVAVGVEPRWALTPLNPKHSDDETTWSQAPWLRFPDAINKCPDEPDPIDLLFGSRKNFLADQIHYCMRRARLSEPERLAAGWTVYVYSKWKISPSEQRFNRLPPSMRPVPEQLQTLHRPRVDMLFWPWMRSRLMRFFSDDEIAEVVLLLACCQKVRWPWGQEILVPDENNVLRLQDKFFTTFMSDDGWGLTQEFIRTYPVLFDGLGTESLVYEPA